MQRTYSRKRIQRRTYPSDSPPEGPPSPEPATTRPRKRQKIEVEVVTPSEPSSHNSRHGIRCPSPSPSKPSTRGQTPASTAEPASSATDQVAPSVRQPVKDLSDIFSFTSDAPPPRLSRKPSKNEGGVARRMLGRSKTDTSVISLSSSDQASAAATSTPTTPKKLRAFMSDSAVGSPSSHAQSPSSSKPNPSEDVSSPPVRPSLTNNNVRTYAGKSRSFLVALPPSQAASMGMDPTLVGSSSGVIAENQEDDLELRESYTELRQRWGVDESEDDPRPVSLSPSPSPKRKGKGKAQPPPPPRLPYGMTNDLKSITELRSKGETRRFLDEVGYLFEGLAKDSALGVRRGSAMEIVTQLCDVEFARRAKAADFLGRAWEVLREAGAGNGDKVLDTILAFYAALVARDPTDVLDLTAKSDFTVTLHRMLATIQHRNDPLWLVSTDAGVEVMKAAGISKGEVTMLGSLHRLVRKKSGLFDATEIISNRLLISHALIGVPPSAHILSHFSPLLNSLTSEVNLLPARVAAYHSGLSLFPPQGPSSYVETPSFLHLDNCLRLLDSCLLGSWSIKAEDSAIQARQLEVLCDAGFTAALIALCACCSIVSRDSDLESYCLIVEKCSESALRVLINLTHGHERWCRAVLDDERSIPVIMHVIISAQRKRRIYSKKLDSEEADPEDIEDAARSLDRLCLALGLLTNLVQAAPDTKSVIRETLTDFDCPGHRRCVNGCTCPSRMSSLNCLAQVYGQYLKSSNELDAVVRGHIAVLLGLLMERAPSNQRALLAALPGTSDRDKLGTLLHHAQDFTAFYVVLTRKMAQAENGGGEEESEEGGAPVSPSSSSRVFKDAMGEAVAKGVIAFLTELRDHGVR